MHKASRRGKESTSENENLHQSARPRTARSSHALPRYGVPRNDHNKNNDDNRQLRDAIVGKAAEDEKRDETRPPAPPLLALPDASFLDASLVPDLWTLRLAAYAAEASARRGRARARSRHTELVVALSGGKNVRIVLFSSFPFSRSFLSLCSLFLLLTGNQKRKNGTIPSDLVRAGDLRPLRRREAPPSGPVRR